MNIWKLLFLIALALVPFGANAAETACSLPKRFGLSPTDVARFEQLQVFRSMGLASALIGEKPGERQIVSDLFSNGFAKISNPNDVAGKFQCRTIKLGGTLPLTVYGWFDCEIFPEEAALVIRKSSGSQRFLGFLRPGGDGLAYKGALSYGYEDVMTLYGQNPERNQVGCLSAIDTRMDHFVLELPNPAFESIHNVIELKRAP